MEVQRIARGEKPHGKFSKWDLWDEIPRDNLPPVATYTCRKIGQIMTIDGRLDEEAWLNAEWSGPYCDINTGAQPQLETQIALLWDDNFLYVGVKIEDHDIRASMTGFHDPVYLQDEDLEIFIEGENSYYEMGVNPINTIYEIRWINVDTVLQNKDWPRLEELFKTPNSLFYIFEKGKPRSRHGDLDWTLEGLKHAVFIDGSINCPEIRDNGWTVEFAIPWNGLQPIMGKKDTPPRDGDTLRINSYRAHHHRNRRDQKQFWEAWTWSQQGCNLIHRPERWIRVEFVNEQ
jgi:hypothetical protein